MINIDRTKAHAALLRVRLATMEAFINGKEIETRSADRTTEKWSPVLAPLWNWNAFDYRIAPPKPKDRYIIAGDKAEYVGGGIYTDPVHADKLRQQRTSVGVGELKVYKLVEVKAL